MLILENSQVSDVTVHKEVFLNGAFFIFHIIQSNKDLWDPPNRQLRNIFSCISSIHWTTEIYISICILFAEGEVNIGDIFTHLANKWVKRSLKNIIGSTCSFTLNLAFKYLCDIGKMIKLISSSVPFESVTIFSSPWIVIDLTVGFKRTPTFFYFPQKSSPSLIQYRN